MPRSVLVILTKGLISSCLNYVWLKWNPEKHQKQLCLHKSQCQYSTFLRRAYEKYWSCRDGLRTLNFACMKPNVCFQLIPSWKGEILQFQSAVRLACVKKKAFPHLQSFPLNLMGCRGTGKSFSYMKHLISKLD